MIIPIDDPDDPRLAPYRNVRERDLVGRKGGFIAEGEVVLRKAVGQGRHPIVSILAAGRRAQDVAAWAPDLPVYQASQAVMDAVAGFPIHRGLLGLGRRAAAEPAHALLARLPERALVLVLVGIANHDNMGGLFRNAAAFGADAVLLDETSCDPLYRKAIRVSVGACLTVPFAGAPQAELPALLADGGFETLALSPRGETPLERLGRAPRAAVLMGAEGPGLPKALMDKARTVSIPMAGGFDSLNVATASGIVLHHLTR